MNTRITYLRKSLQLSQEEFSEQIGITRSLLSHMELNKSPIAERTIIAICSKFNVNEEWLRFGKGEIFNIVDKQYEEFFEIYQNLSKPLQDFLLTTGKELLNTQNKL